MSDCFQMEFPFMESIKKTRTSQLYNQEDLLFIFEFAYANSNNRCGFHNTWSGILVTQAMMKIHMMSLNLRLIDNWFKLKDPKSTVVTQVIILKDNTTERFFCAEREQSRPDVIANAISTCEVEINEFDYKVMVWLPEVKKIEGTWRYIKRLKAHGDISETLWIR